MRSQAVDRATAARQPKRRTRYALFECVGYDHDVFRFLQEATTREAASPMEALVQHVENLNTLRSTVSDCLYDFVEKQEAAEEQRRLHAESAQ